MVSVKVGYKIIICNILNYSSLDKTLFTLNVLRLYIIFNSIIQTM